MKILLFFVTVVCAVQANIVIQVIQEVKGGYGGNNGGGGGGGDETTEGELDLDALENELNALNEELNNLQNQADAAVAAADAIAEANSAIQAVLDALNSGGRKRRRHRRSVVDLEECDPNVSLDGEVGVVMVTILGAIEEELAGLADSLDPTKLNCYIALLNGISADVEAGTLDPPDDMAAVTNSANSAGSAAANAQTAVDEVADNIAASITAAEEQIAATQDAINEAGGSEAVETTTETLMNSTEEQTTTTSMATTSMATTSMATTSMATTTETLTIPFSTGPVPLCQHLELLEDYLEESEDDLEKTEYFLELMKVEGNITSSGVTDDEISDILLQHNNLRLLVASGEEDQGNPGPQPNAANMREIVWNEDLASEAETWAKQCPLSHDWEGCEKICSKDYESGQNVFHIWHEKTSPLWEEVIDRWYGEVKDMANVDVQIYLDLADKTTKHYTQIVWAETYEVGCGRVHYSTTLKEEFTDGKIYVCNYGPAGNIDEEPMYIEGPQASQCTDDKLSETYDGLCA